MSPVTNTRAAVVAARGGGAARTAYRTAMAAAPTVGPRAAAPNNAIMDA